MRKRFPLNVLLRISRAGRKRLQGAFISRFRYRYPRFARFFLGLYGREPYFGLKGLDRVLIGKLGNKRNGFYIELGANDGVRQSNTLLLELYFGWTGILIEPVKEISEELRKNRSGRNNRMVQAACVSFEFPDREIMVAKSNLMTAPIGVDSDIPDPVAHAREGLAFISDANEVVLEAVPALPLQEILSTAKSPSDIDLLSLDVEGAELEVLRGIDFEKHRFGLMLIESRNVQRLQDFLESRGYFLIEKISHHDYLFAPS